MLARFKKKDMVDIVRDTDSNIKLYEFFIKNEEKKYVVVLDSNDKVIGVIYRNDVKNALNFKNIKQYITKRLVTVSNKKTFEEVEQLIFSIAKEQIDIIVRIDLNGKFDGIWEKIVNSCSDFYEKYIFIKQAGYSISDWISYYYGKDATIGIHAWCEYTELFLNELENKGVKVKFVAQANGNSRGAWGEKFEKAFADISAEEVKECDVIINTFMSLQSQVKFLYGKYRNYHNVVSLYDVVDEIYSYERDAGYMLRVANLIADSGRQVYIFHYPRLLTQKNRSNREELLLQRNLSFQNMKKMIEEYYYEMEEIIMPAFNKAREKYLRKKIEYDELVETYPQMSVNAVSHLKYVGNSCTILDKKSINVNIVNGMRVTIPAKSNDKIKKRIHFFGKSWIFGHHCTDELTIPSCVQRILNEKNLNYQVYNHGVPGLREDILANYMYEWDSKLPKDEIFVLIHMFADYGNQYNKNVAMESGYVNSLSSDRPHEYGEIWVDSGHIGEDGSELLAKQIVSKLFLEGDATIVPGVFRNKFNPSAGRTIYKYENQDQVSLWADMPEFKAYQKYISEHKQRIGGIVMNCNPFTLGHRYLIETAATQCDKLYIFVVEEDKSIFPFKDRLELVKKGVSDLSNVTVLQSGNFIISALTFPGYFNKSVNNNVSVDTSDDLTLFAKHIAKTLGINVRFAGEEPLDNITRQYNETMREILPKYDIEFVEIPRKEMGDAVISASRVRKLLNEKKFEEISQIVPITTLEYLKQNFEMLKERLEKEHK